MLKKITMVMMSALCLFLLSSCGGPINYIVNLNPNAFKDLYLTNNEISQITPQIKFSKGEFTDSRKDKKYFSISRSTNINILTDNEFNDAFYDGLKEFFKTSSQSWADIGESDIKINVELLETQSELLTGFWIARYTSRVTTKITFIDMKNNKTIYQETYNGKSDLPTSFGHISMFKMVVNKSIVDCINQIGADKKLHEALANRMR
jgi:uncharacterized lipoprotein YajG